MRKPEADSIEQPNDINPDWERLQNEWATGGLRVLNELINSANTVGAVSVSLQALVKKRDELNKTREDLK